MKFENPLERIKKMNADNAAKKAAESAAVVKQEKINQDNIDTEYSLAVEEKEVYSKQIIRLCKYLCNCYSLYNKSTMHT